MKQINHLLTGADLAWTAEVGPGLVLFHPTGVVWGRGVQIGAGAKIQQGVTVGGQDGLRADGFPRIGDDVRLGAGCRVLGPVRLGSGVTVGANAVVLRDAPDDATLIGVPARLREVDEE